MIDFLRRVGLGLRIVGFVGQMLLAMSASALRRKYYQTGILTRFFSSSSAYSSPTAAEPPPKNVVIIGASFAGYMAARALRGSLPPGYRLVVVEPHSHFHFTWVFPRFCVLDGGHERKAFIPYSLFRSSSSTSSTAAEAREQDWEEKGRAVRWIQGRATELTKDLMTIKPVGGKDEQVLSYEFVILATGSVSKDQSIHSTGGLPSRVVDDDREEGANRMVNMQARIRDSKRLVVVGGGAAGVELATDAASKYNLKEDPERKIVLVHSRSMPMHRFGPRLQAAALEGLRKLGVEVILEDRVVGTIDEDEGMVTLSSGKKLECDFLVDCAGQKPASSLISTLAPHCLTPSGHVKIRPTLQLDDDELSHIYACGDVAETGNKTPNGRAAVQQAMVAADNIVACAWGKKEPTREYSAHWVDAHIKLTLGLEDSIMHFGDGDTELLFAKKDGQTLMVKEAWAKMGTTPFEGLEKPKP